MAQPTIGSDAERGAVLVGQRRQRQLTVHGHRLVGPDLAAVQHPDFDPLRRFFADLNQHVVEINADQVPYFQAVEHPVWVKAQPLLARGVGLADELDRLVLAQSEFRAPKRACPDLGALGIEADRNLRARLDVLDNRWQIFQCRVREIYSEQVYSQIFEARDDPVVHRRRTQRA